jgi:L-fuculose-phosphate aldolase
MMARMGDDREVLAAAGRRLGAAGLTFGASGNLSLRRGDEILTSPAGAELAGLQAEAVVAVDLDGTPVAGGVPTSELGLHLELYRQHGAGAVVHSHPPVGTALSCVMREVPAVHYAMHELGGAIPVAPYARFATPELARAVSTAIAGRTAALMANHGAVTFAEDLGGAVHRALLVEWACTVYWRAAAVGEPAALDAAQIAEVSEEFRRRAAASQSAGG